MAETPHQTTPGSSPHTRGAPSRPWRRRGFRGIIPAYAGSTQEGLVGILGHADHPRIRGEHTGLISDKVVPIGSSPHTRGARSIGRRTAGANADHPRIRGEHQSGFFDACTAVGSSPHTRGAPTHCLALHQALRIIPAYAGSTRAAAGTGIEHWDHPRIRGEHRRFSSPSLAIDGSSPHTRGAPERGSEKKSGCRIIPAYAGSTWSRSTCRPSPRDHPRIRGEHMPLTRVRTMSSGSSPHTRGARAPPDHVQGHGWIIPAYAGSTLGRLSRAPTGTDHPRIRGEHIQKQSADSTGKGSSPHTRGAPRVESRRGILGGIIPAYAGSTVGGNTADRVIQGSSPHTRGAPSRGSHTSAWTGIIPAYAGSTNLPTAGDDKAADHPRIRGEHWSPRTWRHAEPGSSPHTRGAHPVGFVHGGRIGIIPAYAGSTGPGVFDPPRGRDHPRIRGEHARVGWGGVCRAGSSPHTRGARPRTRRSP